MPESLGITNLGSTTTVSILARPEPVLIYPNAVIKSGQNLTKGTLLAIKTADSKFYILNTGASDGTQTLVGVLAEDCDATSEDKTAPVYTMGIFKKDQLTATVAPSVGIFKNGTILIVEEY